MRGEHHRATIPRSEPPGSAPRARGTRRPGRKRRDRRRISPACAGNTTGSRPATCPPTDQPRVRGEHRIRSYSCGCSGGSAPRARGTRDTAQRRRTRRRISPACAGNTSSLSVTASAPPDQPRVPRGTRRRQRLPDRVERISPACAGNTACRCATSTQTADQPRVRGEHWPGLAFTGALFGSAPRARGTPLVSGDVYVSCRISPACAGNTGGLGASSSCGSDQPRVRGEHGLQFGELRLIHGSAPRARGTRLLGPTGDLQVRISPACAGNTRSSTAA